MASHYPSTTKRWRATPSGQASTARYEASEAGRATRRRAQCAWKARNQELVREHNRILKRVQYAVATGRLVRTPCAVCGADRVQAHHHLGYAPEHVLDVVWLCSLHHRAAHASQGAPGMRQHLASGVPA